MSNRLLRYELALFRRSFGDAFGRTRDRILLALVLVVIVLALPAWLQELAGRPLPPGAALAAVTALAPAYAWQRLAAERLRWLAEESAIAADALDHSCRRSYLAAAHILLLLLVLPGLLILGTATGSAPAPALGIAAYAAGSSLAAIGGGSRLRFRPAAQRPIPPSAARGRSAAFRAILRRPTLDSRSPAAAALAAIASVFLATAAAAHLGAGLGLAGAFAAASLPSLVAVLLVSRLDSELLGFLPFAGFGPGFVAMTVSALPVGCSLAAALGVLASGVAEPRAILLGLFLLYALGALIAVARAWLYPGRSRRSAEIQLQIELLAAAVLAMAFPPVLPIALAGRFLLLRRRYLMLLWKQP